MSWRNFDESDVRVRPNPRGSRPRSKDRPPHEDAVSGFVVAVDRGRYTVLLDERAVTAMKARELSRAAVVVGDEVALVGDTSGGRDGLARIIRVAPRASVLRRTADDTDPVERVIVANADQLVIVSALANPQPRPRLIDRCLVAAYDAGLDPLLVLTKSDLVDPGPFLGQYAPLEVPYVVTSWAGASSQHAGAPTAEAVFRGLDELHGRLVDRISVLVGHSGVGKSTIVNALVPDARRATGDVNDVTGRGRHTSSSAVALRLPGGAGWVIDTPGLRSFGLAHVRLDRVISNFPDLEPGTRECPRGCSHDEPECALDGYVASARAGTAGRSRLESLRRLLRSRGAPSEGSG